MEMDGINLPKLPKSMEYSRETDATHGQADETKEVVANLGMKDSGKRALPKTNTTLKYASAPTTAMYIQSF